MLNQELEFKIEKALESIKVIYKSNKKEIREGVYVNSGILFYKNYSSSFYETILSGNSIFVSTTYNPLGAIWVLNYYRVLGEPSLLYINQDEINVEWIDAPKEVIKEIMAQHIMLGKKPKKIKISKLINLAQSIL